LNTQTKGLFSTAFEAALGAQPAPCSMETWGAFYSEESMLDMALTCHFI